jgi:hypothetical protein
MSSRVIITQVPTSLCNICIGTPLTYKKEGPKVRESGQRRDLKRPTDITAHTPVRPPVNKYQDESACGVRHCRRWWWRRPRRVLTTNLSFARLAGAETLAAEIRKSDVKLSAKASRQPFEQYLSLSCTRHLYIYISITYTV